MSTKSNQEHKEKLIEIFLKHRKNRTLKDEKYLYYALKNLDYFSKIIRSSEQVGDLKYRSVLQHLKFRLYSQETPIYKPNEMVTSMFFVIQGEVDVYQSQKILRTNSRQNKKLDLQKITIVNSIIMNPEKEIETTLLEGDVFGIEDIESGKQRRAQLVQAKPGCIIGELSKLDYIMIFHKTFFLEKLNIVSFLEKTTLFSKIQNPHLIESIYIKSKLVKHKRDEVLFNQGDPFDKVYIIKNGAVKISLTYDRTVTNYFDLETFNPRSSKFLDAFRFTTLRRHELRESYDEVMLYKLFNLENGEILGDIEFCYSKNYHLLTATFNEDTEILELSLKDFTTIFPSKYMNLLKEYSSKKLEYVRKRILDITSVKGKGLEFEDKYKKTIVEKINRRLSENPIPPPRLFSATPKFKKVYYKNPNFDGSHTKAETISYGLQNEYISTNETMCERSKNSFRKKKVNPVPPVRVISYCKLSKNKSRVKLLNTSLKDNNWRKLNDTAKTTKTATTRPCTSVGRRVPMKTINLKSDIQSRRLLSTANKKDYGSCFEVNKNFYLNNNTSILRNELKDIFYGKSAFL